MSQRMNAAGKFPVTSSREDALPESQWTMDFDNYEEVRRRVVGLLQRVLLLLYIIWYIVHMVYVHVTCRAAQL